MDRPVTKQRYLCSRGNQFFKQQNLYHYNPDQFKMVGSSSGAQQVGADNTFTPMTQNGLSAAKNGYLYVYVSNETPNINVYFDNLQVTHIHGPLLQEQSYYPFGLEMAGISDKALGKLDSKNKFNGGVEMEEDYGVNLYSTFYRQYDPQIGRFSGVDCQSEASIGMSVYQFGANNPISYNDPLGNKQTAGLYGGSNGYYNSWQLDRAESFLFSSHGGGDDGGGGGGGGYTLTGDDAVEFFKGLSNADEEGSEVDSIPAHFGIGLQGTVGLGWGQKGSQQTIGFFITTDGTLTLFNSDGTVDKKKDGFIMDLSAAAQGLFIYSPNGKMDVSGSGQSDGWSIDPASASYSTDNKLVHDFYIYTAGPSTGIKVSASSMQTQTNSWSINLIDWWVNTFARDY